MLNHTFCIHIFPRSTHVEPQSNYTETRAVLEFPANCHLSVFHQLRSHEPFYVAVCIDRGLANSNEYEMKGQILCVNVV